MCALNVPAVIRPLLLLLAAATPLSCGNSEPELAVGRVHDLYALFGTAAVQSAEKFEEPPQSLFRLVYLDNKVDDRDRVASIHAPTPTSLIWRDLDTYGEAQLTFGLGVVPLSTEPAPVPVVFRIEGREESLEDAEFITLFEETLTPTDLANPKEILRRSVSLPKSPDARWTLRFTTTLAGKRGRQNWPGWFEPILRSEGQQVDRAESPLVVRTVYEDLVTSLDQAEVHQENSASPVQTSAFDAGLEVPGRGRFRAHQLTTFKNFTSNARRAERAVKHDGDQAPPSLDLRDADGSHAVEPADERPPENAFERAWAQSVLQAAKERLRADYSARGRAVIFDGLLQYLGGAEVSHADTAQALGMTEGAVRVAVGRLRQTFGVALRAEIAQTLTDPVVGGRRTLVSAAAPSRISWRLDIPSNSTLDFAVGMDSEHGWARPGDGMTFAVEIDAERIWELTLNPHSVVNDRGWNPASIDLTPWAGTTIELSLVTETGADPANDVGGWANLRVLRDTHTRRLARGEAPNVLVLLMDTLRADRFGSYGNPNNLTPQMDALAANGIRFANARTVASYTWPSTASLFTGLYPHAHGVLSNEQAFLVDRVETLAELFSQAGYTTGAFVANPLISPWGNFQQGFESFVNAPAVRARALNERVTHWLEGREGNALFTYVHYFDPHNPYNPPEGYAPGDNYSQDDTVSLPHVEAIYSDVVWDKNQRRDFKMQNSSNLQNYDAEVMYQDAAIGELLSEWDRRGLLENTLVVLMSDHGEEFFEHGRPFHGPNLYDESLFIPLIVTGFGEAALQPSVVEQPVQITDVLPTLCALAGVDRPQKSLDGRPLIENGRASPKIRSDEPLYCISMNGEAKGIEGMTEKLAILWSPWKLIYTPAINDIELYRLDLDPGELDNLAQSEPAVRERLMNSLESWLTEAVETGAQDTRVTPEQVWFLKQLGYTK